MHQIHHDYGLLRVSLRGCMSDEFLASAIEAASYQALQAKPSLARAVQELIEAGDTPGHIASKAEDCGASALLIDCILMGARFMVKEKNGRRAAPTG